MHSLRDWEVNTSSVFAESKMQVEGEESNVGGAKGGGSGLLSISLHPLVIINISDHSTRFKALNSGKSKRVLGVLLGKLVSFARVNPHALSTLAQACCGCGCGCGCGCNCGCGYGCGSKASCACFACSLSGRGNAVVAVSIFLCQGDGESCRRQIEKHCLHARIYRQLWQRRLYSFPDSSSKNVLY